MAKKTTFNKDGYITHAGYRIKRIVKHGNTRYQLGLRNDSQGKYKRLTCLTLEDAKMKAESARLDVERSGLKAKEIPDSLKLDAVEALKILEGTGANLVRAANEYVRLNAPPEDSISVANMVDRFLTWMEQTPRKLKNGPSKYRPETIRDAERKLNTFKRDMGERKAISLNTEDITKWLDGQNFNPKHYDNHKRYISMLFTWAIDRNQGGCLVGAPNPAKGIQKPEEAKTLPQIFTYQEVTKLMKHLGDHKPELVAYFALGFFAGIRPEEITRISWQDIDFETGEIHISADASKTHSERLVTISDNLRAWLVQYPPIDGKIAWSESTMKCARREIKKLLDKPWPLDVARHCFSTYHCALHGMESTAEELGHTSTAMLHKHYKGLVKNRKAHAEKYFAIQPPAPAKIIQLKA